MVGQGPVGLSATQLAAAMGAKVIALDVSAERLKRAKEFGADALIDPKADDAVAAIRALTHGAGADRTLDTSGTADGRLIAVRGARPWGVVCFVGEGGDVTIDVSPQMLRKQLTIIGSWTFSTTIQADCARFVADNKIDVEHLFTDRWQLDAGRDGLSTVRPSDQRQGRVLDVEARVQCRRRKSKTLSLNAPGCSHAMAWPASWMTAHS